LDFHHDKKSKIAFEKREKIKIGFLQNHLSKI